MAMGEQKEVTVLFFIFSENLQKFLRTCISKFMHRRRFILLSFLLVGITSVFAAKRLFFAPTPEISGAPPYGEPENQVPDLNPYAWIKDWKRPEGPARVGLQVGHWKNDELPEELKKLIGNTGASGGGKWEWEVNHAIAEATAEILRAEGVIVDILPSTVPPDYVADAFIAIHADGSEDRSARGFKVAPPWRDLTGKADDLTAHIETTYQQATNFGKDPNISRNMRGYYAFAFWRYEHSVHPMTTSVIVETGFLTNASDRTIIVQKPHVSAQGIADGILAYLEQEKLLQT